MTGCLPEKMSGIFADSLMSATPKWHKLVKKINMKPASYNHSRLKLLAIAALSSDPVFPIR